MTEPVAERVRKVHKGSPHFGPRHPAVAAVACPVCHQPRGVGCRITSKSPFEGNRTETHVGRVRVFEREALPGAPGSVLPPSPVDTDNDCAP